MVGGDQIVFLYSIAGKFWDVTDRMAGVQGFRSGIKYLVLEINPVLLPGISRDFLRLFKLR
jgi:hypothetical protein